VNKVLRSCDLEKCFLCSNTVPEWHETISLHKQNLKFKKGEVIFSEGQPVTGIYFVYEGTAKIHKKWDGDKELIIRFSANGAIMGHRGLGSKMIYSVSATAVEPLTVCFIDMKFFEASLKTNSSLCYKLMVLFAEELESSEQRMRDLAHMPVKGRVARALLVLEEQFGCNKAGTINLLLSRNDLAAFAAATYETVYRVITALVKEKIITVTGRQIAIDDRDRLIELTRGSADE
jgi:CRP-like cAMP-binding protein